MSSNRDQIKLHLEPWQSRIASHFLPGRKTNWANVTIDPGQVTCPASYKIPTKGLTQNNWLFYLTDGQMAHIKEVYKLKIPISSINITEDHIKSGNIVFK